MACISPCQSGFSVSLLTSATTSERSDFLRIAAPKILLPVATPARVSGARSPSMTSNRRASRATLSMNGLQMRARSSTAAASRSRLREPYQFPAVGVEQMQLAVVHLPEPCRLQRREEAGLEVGGLGRGASHAGSGDGREAQALALQLDLGEIGVAAATSTGAHVTGDRQRSFSG